MCVVKFQTLQLKMVIYLTSGIKAECGGQMSGKIRKIMTINGCKIYDGTETKSLFAKVITKPHTLCTDHSLRQRTLPLIFVNRCRGKCRCLRT